MNVKEKLQKLIELYELAISFYNNSGYYGSDCEYDRDQARASKLEEVVADLKAIVETI